MTRGPFTLNTVYDSPLDRANTALRTVLLDKAVQRGEFTLSSGLKSSYYIDCRRASMSYVGMAAIGQVVIQYLNDEGLEATVVVGPESAGIPLVSAALMVGHRTWYHINGIGLEGSYVRKAQKQHGMQNLIEGYKITERDTVVMLEDVVTTGESVVKAIEAVKATGAKIIMVMALVDRLKNGGEYIRGAGVPFVAFHDVTTLSLEPLDP